VSADKTEQPTRRRQRRALEDGDVPVSSALTQTAGFGAAVLLLPSLAEATVSYVRAALGEALEVTDPVAALQGSAVAVLALSTPLLGAALVAALGVGLLQTQARIAPGRLAPDLSRLDPVAGFKRLFQLDRSFATLRSLLVVLAIGVLSFRLMKAHAGDLVATVGAWRGAWVLAAFLSLKLLQYAVLAALVLALVDVAVIRRSWMGRIRMTRDEVKREHRESEGDPKVKQERKRAHQQMLQGATLNAIKNATIVVVNPTHYATALFYSEEETIAPRVVAQGHDVVARQIIEAARAYGVPVVREVSLARALDTLEVGEEIPEILYEAVAEVLRHVAANPEEVG
jgi:type III secretion protein U